MILLTCTLIGVAFFVGLLLGAGIMEAGARPEREKNRELVLAINKLALTLQHERAEKPTHRAPPSAESDATFSWTSAPSDYLRRKN
jgi:hypothetical protein